MAVTNLCAASVNTVMQSARHPDTSSEEESDAEMADFVVDDSDVSEDGDFTSHEESDDDDDDNSHVEEDTNEVAEPAAECVDDLDGIDRQNIVSSKRVSRKPSRYIDEIFQNDSTYRKMMICDVPADEMYAALEDTEFSSDDDSVQDAYDDEEEDVSEEVEEMPRIQQASSSKSAS